MSSLTTLPPELIEAIAQIFAEQRVMGYLGFGVQSMLPDALEARRALRHLSTTHSALRRTVQPMLFRVFDGCSTVAQAALFFRSICPPSNDHLRLAVRRVQIFALVPYCQFESEPFEIASRRFSSMPDPDVYAYDAVERVRKLPTLVMALLLLGLPNLQALRAPWPVRYDGIIVDWVLPKTAMAVTGDDAVAAKLKTLAIHTPGSWSRFIFGGEETLLSLPSLRCLNMYGVGIDEICRFPAQTYHITTLEIEQCAVPASVFESLCDACIALKSVKLHLATDRTRLSSGDDYDLTVERAVQILLRHRESLHCLHIRYGPIPSMNNQENPNQKPVLALMHLDKLEELQISFHALTSYWGEGGVSSLADFLPVSLKRLNLTAPEPHYFPAVRWLAEIGHVAYPNLRKVEVTLRNQHAKDEYVGLREVFQKNGVDYAVSDDSAGWD